MVPILKMQYNCLLYNYIQLISIYPHSQMQSQVFKRLNVAARAGSVTFKEVCRGLGLS
jgi:hypothetical protein